MKTDYRKVKVSQCHFRIESKHQRWSSWSPSRPTFGCFDSMEVKSRFVLKMAFWILTKIYIWYSINSCLRFTWSDRFHNEFDFFVAWDDLHCKSVTFPLSGYWNCWKKNVYMDYLLLGRHLSSIALLMSHFQRGVGGQLGNLPLWPELNASYQEDSKIDQKNIHSPLSWSELRMQSTGINEW